MRLALWEARKALGKTHPNPAVGAVVVRDGRVVAAGHHAFAGAPHAEAVALAAAGAEAEGADLYVTLEPCDHHGRTPPCSMAVLGAGIRRVFTGSRDPNPLVDGRGVERLRAAGVEVVTGVLAPACDALNAGWLRRMGRGSRAEDRGASAAPSGVPRLRLAVLASRYNGTVTELLVAGAQEALRRHGVPGEVVTWVRTPGVLELPREARRLASGPHDGVLVLGAVVRDATIAFEAIVGGITDGLARAALSSGRPVAAGLVACETMEQAMTAAALELGDAGGRAASALVTELLERKPARRAAP